MSGARGPAGARTTKAQVISPPLEPSIYFTAVILLILLYWYGNLQQLSLINYQLL